MKHVNPEDAFGLERQNYVEWADRVTTKKDLLESDEDACKRIFGGKEYPCRLCRMVIIYWPGVCDACEKILIAEKKENERREDQLRRDRAANK